MEFILFGHGPEESYSRQLDKRVAVSEMPYGYDHNPIPQPPVPEQQNLKKGHRHG